MAQRKFKRKIEDFVCEKCGAKVKGNGYTDHCPICLWGKHADVNPGDRGAGCGGIMKPTGVALDHGKNIIMYRCEKCGCEFRVKAAENDEMNAIIKLINK